MDTQKKKEENNQPLNEHNINIIMESILKKSNIKMIFHKNEGGKEPYFTYDKICYGEENKEISNQQFKEIEEYLENKENNTNTNYKLFFDYLADIKKKIKEQFKYDYPLRFKIEIEKEDKDKDKDNDTDNIYSISSTMTFYPPFNDKENSKERRYRDRNILIDRTNSKDCGFTFMINDINWEGYKEIKSKAVILENKKSLINNNSNLNNKKEGDLKNKKSLINNSSNLNNKTEGVLENLSTGFKTGSEIKCEILKLSNVIKNYIKDEIYKKELSEGLLKDWNNNNINKKTKKNYIQEKIIIESKNDTNLKSLKKNISLDDKQKILVRNIILMKVDKEITSILCAEEGIFILIEPHLNNTIPTLTKIYNKLYIGGIKINKNLVALTSNSISSNGEDKLLLYNLETKEINILLEGYSFILSQNNLSLINIPDSSKKDYECNEIILCACKKYKKKQNNGILFAILNLNNITNNNIYNKFYNTNNFEVFCFCQIANINININKEESPKAEISYTKYILVGGFDSDKKEGLIKLYELNFKKNINDCEIKFIQDILIKKKDNLKKIKAPITSITQSGSSGNILLTCVDGNAYLFDQPELGYFDSIKDIKFD